MITLTADSIKSKYTFYKMNWKNRFGERITMLVEERKMAIYVELYQAERKEVWFEDE